MKTLLSDPAALATVIAALLGFLGGTLINHRLAIYRADRARDKEARAVAAAIRGEMASIRLSMADLLPIWRHGKEVFEQALSSMDETVRKTKKVDARDFAKLGPFETPVFKAYASKLGLLGSDTAGAVSVIYSNYSIRAAVFDESLEILAVDLPEHFAAQIGWAENFCADCKDFEGHLLEFERTGRPPRVQPPPRTATARPRNRSDTGLPPMD